MPISISLVWMTRAESFFLEQEKEQRCQDSDKDRRRVVREDGVRPFDEAKTALRVAVLRLKKLEKIKAQVDEFYASLKPTSDLLTAELVERVG